MNARIIVGSAAALVAIGIVGYAAMAQNARGTPVQAQMPTINQDTVGEAIDNSRECQPGVPEVACVYL